MADLLIEEDDAERLIQRYDREDHDPLDLKRRSGDTNAGVIRICGAMLAGLIEVRPEAPIAKIDVVAAHLLAHLGIHPGAAAAIAEMARGIGVVHREGDEPFACVFSPTDKGTIDGTDVHDGVLRWVHGTLHVPALPETVMLAVNALDESPPLRTVVSHPALDRMDILVLGMETPSPHISYTSIMLDNDVAPLTREQLDAVWSLSRPAQTHH